MNTLVVYDSQFGNTERIAKVIADTFHAYGPTQAVQAVPGGRIEIEGIELLVVGSPTQGWRPTRPIQSFLDGMSPERLRGISVACFDTRFRKSRWLTGSAAGVMAKILNKFGITLVVAPESFFVMGTQGPLYDGELDRAAGWARMLFNRVEAAVPSMRR